MRARSHYETLGGQQFIDRRGQIRTVTLKAGRNKGKTYPYAGTRQTTRQTKDTAYGRKLSTWLDERGMVAYVD